MEMIKIREIARETIQVLRPAEERYFDIFWKVMSPWIEKENQNEVFNALCPAIPVEQDFLRRLFSSVC